MLKAASRCASTLNKYSARITQPERQGGSQAMLYGAGLSEAARDGRRGYRPRCRGVPSGGLGFITDESRFRKNVREQAGFPMMYGFSIA